MLEFATHIRLDSTDCGSSRPEKMTAVEKRPGEEKPQVASEETCTSDEHIEDFHAINSEQPLPSSRRIQGNAQRREADGGVRLVDDEWVDDRDTLPPAYTDIRP